MRYVNQKLSYFKTLSDTLHPVYSELVYSKYDFCSL